MLTLTVMTTLVLGFTVFVYTLFSFFGIISDPSNPEWVRSLLIISVDLITKVQNFFDFYWLEDLYFLLMGLIS
jgi:ABC-type dipeptide/oligopeptide/nickel transport system permease subunit